jgi:hypothetical protein
MNGLPCQDAELKAGKYGGQKTLEKLGCKKYVIAKITQVNTVQNKWNTTVTTPYIQIYH